MKAWWLAVALVSGGCDSIWRLDTVVLPGDASIRSDGSAGEPDAAACTFTAWSMPLVSAASMPGIDNIAPAVSPDGMWLVFHRPILGEGFDLFIAHRIGNDFGAAQSLAIANTATDESYAFWSSDGTRLYFSRGSGNTSGDQVLEMEFDGQNFTTPMVARDFPGAAFPYLVRPRLARNDTAMYYFAGNPADLYEALRGSTTSPWTTLALPNVSDAATPDDGPTVSADELTLYFSSKRGGDGTVRHLYVATRARVDDTFASPTELDLPGEPAQPADPDLSRDGTLLVFAAYQASTADLYVATRSCQ